MPRFISLAQWTRADGYEPEGWEFESLTRYSKKGVAMIISWLDAGVKLAYFLKQCIAGFYT